MFQTRCLQKPTKMQQAALVLRLDYTAAEHSHEHGSESVRPRRSSLAHISSAGWCKHTVGGSRRLRTYSCIVPDLAAVNALNRNSSDDSSSPWMTLGTYLAGPYEDKGHNGRSWLTVRSLVMESTLQFWLQSCIRGWYIGGWKEERT